MLSETMEEIDSNNTRKLLRGSILAATVLAVVEIVMVVDAAELPSRLTVGVAQVAAAGNALQVNVRACLKPLIGCTVIRNFAACPAATDILAGDTVRPKSGFAVTVICALADLLGSATLVTVTV